METDKAMELEAFQRALVPQRIRTWQIIYAALLAGATVFAGIVLMLNFSQPQAAEAGDATQVRLLTQVHIFVAVGAYVFAWLMNRYWTGPKGLHIIERNAALLSSAMAESTREALYLQAVFTGAIIRAALMEGAALFGVIVCLLGVLQGVIRQQPVYWLNLASYAIFAGMILGTFPTRQRLEDQFKERFNVL